MMNSTSFASWSSLVVSCLLIVGAGCSNIDGDSSSPTSPNDSDSAYASQGDGIAVSSAALQSSSTDKIKFVVYECQATNSGASSSGSSYGPKVAQQVKDLEAMTLPGGIETFENKPFDEDSEHQFADAYFTLDEGCYDVKTIPLKSNGDRNHKCEKAHDTNLEVTDGQTLETLLINQCEGKKRGGLDVISALNHAPHIKKIKFHPSKFMKCHQRGAICFKAKDPDNDPLRSRVKFRGNQPKYASEPFPKHILTQCKRFCSNGGDQQVWNADGHGGNENGVKACLPRCVESALSRIERRCRTDCASKCNYGDNGPVDVSGGDGNGNGNGGGKQCYKRCKQRCQTPNGKIKRCILVNPDYADSYTITAKVFDQLWSDAEETVFQTAGRNGGNGNGNGYGYSKLIDFETYYDLQDDYPDDLESRDTLTFPLHVGGKCDGNGKCDKCLKKIDIKGYIVYRNGSRHWAPSRSHLQQGDKIKVVFRVPETYECGAVKLRFASYNDRKSDKTKTLSERIYDSATKQVGPGLHAIGPIQLPDCSYQTSLGCYKNGDNGLPE